MWYLVFDFILIKFKQSEMMSLTESLITYVVHTDKFFENHAWF